MADFDPSYTQFSASGFRSIKKKHAVCIRAIFKENTDKKYIDSSEQAFFFDGHVFALSPSIRFDWTLVETENDDPVLVIEWQHIGDENAEKYILHFDDKQIKHIRQNLIGDVIEVRLFTVKKGTKHTVQVVARLNNNIETDRSDIIEFQVPNKIPDNINNDSRYINILQESPPSDFSVSNDDVQPDEELPLVETEKPPNSGSDQSTPEKPRCCCLLPHQSFPGIDHYLDDNRS
ncbi:unnamed protein product [Adineta steineri]|uniref:Uncharacterized protein n=1 Tax=Adineta steineri TaxID=433720 RepID=A0A819JTF5_9BILA|nr:unnamed protein product [Adineta steineri]